VTADRDSRPPNLDPASVAGFGDEWSRFDQRESSTDDLQRNFEKYFAVFPWDSLPPSSVGFDLGCGSGRWSRLLAPRVGTLHCVDASEKALDVARRNLASCDNCVIHHASVDDLPFADASMDFGFSLGVLHHVPDTERGIRDCVAKLRPGAPFLLYLYYAFDNRPWWFRALWRGTDVVRHIITRLPTGLKHVSAELIAATIYWPLAKLAALAERLGVNVVNFPLTFYRDQSYYTMRTDALDRFGTRLERRFTAGEIRAMMERAGLSNIRFSSAAPYWCAVGTRV
jgi:SAM-dependent methyltransferase